MPNARKCTESLPIQSYLLYHTNHRNIGRADNEPNEWYWLQPDDISRNDIRLGFYFNGEFFDFNKDGKNTEADRITLFNCDMSKVGNVFSIEKGAQATNSDGIKLESVVPKSETRDIIPVSLDGFQPVTLNNFYNINYTGTEERPRTLQDGTYTYENAHSNGYQPQYNITNDGKNTSTFDKKLLSVKMQCETTGATTRLRILASGYQSGGVALQKNNDGTKLCFYNIASFGTRGDNMTSDDFYFVPGKEYKINSFNEEFILQISIEYGNFTKDGVEPDTVPNNDIKFGFYINGQLYDVNGDGSYDEKDRLTLLNCNSSLMGNMLTVEPRLSGGSITLSSYVVEDEMSKLTNLEWTDFEGTNQQPAEERAYMSGTGKYTLKKENVSKLGSTSFEAKVLFTGGFSSGGIYYGGANDYQGINLRPLASGKLAVLFSPINTGLTYVEGSTIGEGGTIILQPDTAGVTSFLNKEFKLSITTRYADYDGDGSADDVELGFFINDKLYDNRYMYLKDYTTYKTVGNCIYFNLSSPILMRSVPEVDEKLYDLTSGTPYTELGNHFSNIGSVYLKNVQITDYSTLNISGDYDVKDNSGALIGQVILYETNDTHPDGSIDTVDLVAMLKVQQGTALSTWSGTMGAYAADFSETGIINTILGIETVSE